MTKGSDRLSGAAPADRFRHLRFNVLHSCSWVNDGMRQFLQPYGITPKQFSILGILNERAPESLSIQEVRTLLADKMSDASRLVNRLDAKGLVDKFPSDTDRRSNRTRITEEGRRLFTKIDRARADLDAQISTRLSDAEIDELNSLLTRLR